MPIERPKFVPQKEENISNYEVPENEGAPTKTATTEEQPKKYEMITEDAIRESKLLFSNLGKRVNVDVSRFSDIMSELRGFIKSLKTGEELFIPTLNDSTRSAIILVRPGDSINLPENHALHRYQNVNVLVNNNICEIDRIKKAAERLMALEDGEIEIYKHDPMSRLITDSELQVMLMASEGSITEIKNYNEAGELIYHAIRTR